MAVAMTNMVALDVGAARPQHPRVSNHSTQNVPWSALDSIDFATGSHQYHAEIPATLRVQHFENVDSVLTLHRCAPVKNCYPTVVVPSSHRQYSQMMLTIVLYKHGLEHVDVRFPDLKDKFEHFRGRHGIWINPSANATVRMKKKAIDKDNNNVGFRLGVDFHFLTNFIEPLFVIVATPFKDGRFCPKDAIRTPPFRVKSKRNGRSETVPHKRRKKALELHKLNTDIESARNQKDRLQREEARMSYLNNEDERFLRHLHQRAEALPDGPTKIALLYASRPFKKSETVSL